MAAHIDSLMERDPQRKLFGPFPAMAFAHLGRLCGESFCERMGSCSRRKMSKSRTSLKDNTLEMLALLEMNKDFYFKGCDLVKKGLMTIELDKVEDVFYDMEKGEISV